MTVGLRPLGLDDLWLYEAIHCDPAMMEHLGGPLPRDGLAEKLDRDVAATEADECWVLVVSEDSGAAAGTVSVWDQDDHGEPITEIGWMVLPAFQGRGIGRAAVAAVLDRIRRTRRWKVVHAFPPVANERSNAMCRAFGFELLEEREYRFRGRALRCNHFRLDL